MVQKNLLVYFWGENLPKRRKKSTHLIYGKSPSRKKSSLFMENVVLIKPYYIHVLYHNKISLVKLCDRNIEYFNICWISVVRYCCSKRFDMSVCKTQSDPATPSHAVGKSRPCPNVFAYVQLSLFKWTIIWQGSKTQIHEFPFYPFLNSFLSWHLLDRDANSEIMKILFTHVPVDCQEC